MNNSRNTDAGANSKKPVASAPQQPLKNRDKVAAPSKNKQNGGKDSPGHEELLPKTMMDSVPARQNIGQFDANTTQDPDQKNDLPKKVEPKYTHPDLQSIPHPGPPPGPPLPPSYSPTSLNDQSLLQSAPTHHSNNSAVAGTSKTSPQAMFIPNIQNDDIYEFKKKDVVFENSRIMLIVQDGGKSISHKDTNTSTSSPIDEHDPMSHQSMEYLRQLHKEQKLCDLTFKTSDGHSFKLHKVALTARSPKYLDLFKHQDQNRMAEVVLENVSTAAVLTTIDFLYDRDVYLTEDHVEDVLNCALQLDVRGLVEECCKYLEVVDHKNVWNHLKISAKYEAVISNSSREKIINFSTQAFGELIHTDAFAELNVEALSLMLHTEKIHSLGEDVLLRSVTLWLNHDLPQRKGFAVQLLRCVRLNEATPKLINDRIDENMELSQMPEIRSMLLAAYRYHALHPKRAVPNHEGKL